MAEILALHRLSSPNHRHHLKHQNPLTEPSRPFPLHHAQTMEDFRKTHAQFIKLGLDSITPHSGELLSACALSIWGSLDYALEIFLQLEKPCTFEFNVMIRAQVNHGQPESARQLYVKMVEEVNPDNFTFPFVLKACALLSDIRGGMQLHGHTIKFGFEDDVFIHNSLINLYGKCGNIEFSSKVFELLGSNKTVASWSSLLAAYNRMGLWVESLHLFAEMSHENLKPDESSFTTALSSCSNLGSLDLGRSIHCSLLKNYSSLNIITLTSLLHMYMNCGQADKGMMIFERMLEKNLWTYSAAISGLAMHGNGRKALKVFSDMLRKHDLLLLLPPDEAIYVGVLSACSHSLMVEEGLRFFDEMRFEHQIMPTEQHYGCMSDLLSRSGRLKEAYELVKNMPMEPTEATWRSILSACRIDGDIQIAESVYRELEKMGCVNAGDCVILSNMYLGLKRWEDGAAIRTEIVNRGLLQMPGFSKVQVKRKIYTFFSHDKSYKESSEVEEMIYQMEWQLRFEGFKKEMEFNEGRSQKIAIAFALLNTRSSLSPIRIFTNLRMCGDCHEYIALISKIFGREIIVRDRGRFHHFGHGSCSCGSCW